MHMLIPINFNPSQADTNEGEAIIGDLNQGNISYRKNQRFDSYYEVGCKIFEINKIIR